jgi:hypothetical protein
VVEHLGVLCGNGLAACVHNLGVIVFDKWLESAMEAEEVVAEREQNDLVIAARRLRANLGDSQRSDCLFGGPLADAGPSGKVVDRRGSGPGQVPLRQRLVEVVG